MNPSFSQHPPPDPQFGQSELGLSGGHGPPHGEYQGRVPPPTVQYSSQTVPYPPPPPLQYSRYSLPPSVQGPYPSQPQPPIGGPYPSQPQPPVGGPYPPQTLRQPQYQPPYQPQYSEPVQYQSQLQNQGAAPREHSTAYPRATPSFMNGNVHYPYQGEYHNVYNPPMVGPTTVLHPSPQHRTGHFDPTMLHKVSTTASRHYAAMDAHPNASSQGFYTQVPLDVSALHPAPHTAPQTAPHSTAYGATHARAPMKDEFARPPSLFELSYTNPQPGSLNVPGHTIPQQADASNLTIPQPQQGVYDREIPNPQPRQRFYDATIPQPEHGAYGATVPQPQQGVYDATIPQAPLNTSNTTIPQPLPNTSSTTIPPARPDPSTTAIPTSTTHNRPSSDHTGGSSDLPQDSAPLVDSSLPFVRLTSESQQGSVPPTEPSAVPVPPAFLPPLDLGPSATYDDIVSVWRDLSPEDHQLLVCLYIEKERQLAESTRLFTIGSAEPKSSSTANTRKRKLTRPKAKPRSTAQQQGSAPHDQPLPASTASHPAPTDSPPVHTPSNPPPRTMAEQPGSAPRNGPPPTDAPPANTANHRPPTPPPGPPKIFKTVHVEDYHSESDDESEDDEDAVRIPLHAKGKGRAVEQEPQEPGSPSPKIPTLNPRPNVAPPVQNCGAPFGAVLDAFHLMDERMSRLEISMTQGLKQMDAKLSDFSAGPPVTQSPQIPTGRMTKTQSTVARILAGCDTSKTSRRPTSGTRIATRFGYATVPKQTVQPSSTQHPPNFNNGRPGDVPPPTQPRAIFGGGYPGQQGSHPPMSNQVPPASGGGTGGQQSAQPPMSTPIPPGFGGRYSGQQGPHRSTLNQVSPGADNGFGGLPHTTSLQSDPSTAVPPMTEEVMSEKIKLYRKYVRRHLWEQLLGIKGPEQLRERCPRIPDDEYERYLHIKGRVIDATNFRIDFTRGWERCKFNVEARSFFAHHFVASVRGGMYQNPPLPANWITMEMAAEVLDTVIVNIFRVYSEQSKPPTVHNQAKAEMTKERKRANTRRETLLRWRIETLAKLNLERHLVLFANMTPAHLSGDEAAVGSDLKHSHYRLFYIVEAAWQSHVFRNFVRDLDKWYIYFSRPKVGAVQRGGNRPRIREELPKGKARVVDSIAPRGLWRNCYDEDWLNALKVCEREELGMINEDYDFTLPTPPALPVELQPASAATHDNTSFPYPSSFGSSGAGLFSVPGSSLHPEPTVPAASTSPIHEAGPNPANTSAAVPGLTASAATAPSII